MMHTDISLAHIIGGIRVDHSFNKTFCDLFPCCLSNTLIEMGGDDKDNHNNHISLITATVMCPPHLQNITQSNYKHLQKRSKKKIRRIGDNFGNFQYFKEAFKTKSTLYTKQSQ